MDQLAKPISSAAQVCVSCKRQKRRCDKRLPRCSYCERLKRACVYDETISDHAGLKRERVTVCERCWSQKRKCDKIWPSCSRCARLHAPCVYAYVWTQENQITSAHSQKLHTSNDILNDKALVSGNLDPFSCMAINPSQQNNAHFRHFLLHTAKCCWPFRTEILGVWCAQEAVTQPSIFHGLISMSASHRFHLRLNNSTTNSSNERQLLLDSAESRLNMIRTTQKILDNVEPSNFQSVTIMIALLVCVEASNGNIPEMEMHMAGLKELVQLFGGMDTLDLPTIAFLTGTDILRSIVKCEPAALPVSPKYLDFIRKYATPSVRPSSPLEGVTMHLSGSNMFRALGSRFINSTWTKELDQPLRVMIQNFCNLIVHYEADEQRRQHEKQVRFEDNNPWNLSQLYLLSLSYAGREDIREPLRRSILAYSMTRYCKFGAFPCMDIIAGTLKDSLVSRVDHLLSTASDLFFWILYVGALTANRTSKYYQWYCTGLAKLSPTLGLNAWSDVESFLEQFLYIDRNSDKSAERVWQDSLLLRPVFSPWN